MQSSPLLPTSLQWRPFAALTTTHFQKMFALEGPLHQYCPCDSSFRIGMWVPALENLCSPCSPTRRMCYCHCLGKRKDRWSLERSRAPCGEQSLPSACTGHRVNLAWQLPCSAMDLGRLLSAPPLRQDVLVSHSEHPGGQAGTEAGVQTQLTI